MTLKVVFKVGRVEGWGGGEKGLVGFGVMFSGKPIYCIFVVCCIRNFPFFLKENKCCIIKKKVVFRLPF